MGQTYFTCGHTDKVRPNRGWPIRIKTEECDSYTGFHRGVSYASYCLDCYKDALENWPELLLFEDWEVDDHLRGKDYD